MADDKILKPKSFRIDDETAEKFRQITGQLGGNQQAAMAKLIEAYEFQAGKAVLTEKKADIDQFERYVTALTRMYMSSLEANQNITETVRTEFDAQLKSKDATILDLQAKSQTAVIARNEAEARAKEAEDEAEQRRIMIADLQKDYDAQIKNLKSMLTDKDGLNKALADSCAELKNKIKEMASEMDKIDQLRQTLIDTENQLSDCKAKIVDVRQQAAEDQMTYQRDLLESEKRHQTEINSYQQKYLELLEQIKNSNTNNNLSEQQ